MHKGFGVVLNPKSVIGEAYGKKGLDAYFSESNTEFA